MKWGEDKLNAVLSSGLTRGRLAVTEMWREKPLQEPFIESVQGRPGRINYQGNLSRYMNPFHVSLVKILHILCTDLGKHCQQSPPTWTVNLLDILAQPSFISSHPKFYPPETCTLMFMFHSSQGLRKREINQGMVPVFFLQTCEWGSWVLGCTHLHPLPCTPACPCSLYPHPPNPPSGQSWKLMLPSPFQKDVFETKPSVLLSPYLRLFC